MKIIFSTLIFITLLSCKKVIKKVEITQISPLASVVNNFKPLKKDTIHIIPLYGHDSIITKKNTKIVDEVLIEKHIKDLENEFNNCSINALYNINKVKLNENLTALITYCKNYGYHVYIYI